MKVTSTLSCSTKWPEAFLSQDQKAENIACLLVEHIVVRHGVPNSSFPIVVPTSCPRWSEKVCSPLGMENLNTSSYHPQTDGLVKRLTIINMLSKCSMGGTGTLTCPTYKGQSVFSCLWQGPENPSRVIRWPLTKSTCWTIVRSW